MGGWDGLIFTAFIAHVNVYDIHHFISPGDTSRCWSPLACCHNLSPVSTASGGPTQDAAQGLPPPEREGAWGQGLEGGPDSWGDAEPLPHWPPPAQSSPHDTPHPRRPQVLLLDWTQPSVCPSTRDRSDPGWRLQARSRWISSEPALGLLRAPGPQERCVLS